MIQKKEDHDYLFKIIQVGDTKVGKTSFLLRYTKGINPKQPQSTIGVEYATKSVLLKGGEGIVKSQIWDTSGSEKYKSIAVAHYRKSQGALLFYDLTNKESFNNMSKWLKEIQNNNIDKGIQIMVIGNKLDLIEDKTHRRAVDLQQVNQFIQENKLLYAETSAKTGQNVKESFESLIQKIYDEGVKQGNNPQMGHGSYPLNNEPIQTGDSCCSYCQPKV